MELKVCPFCGAAPRYVDDTGYGDCQVFCPNEFNGCPAPDVQSLAGEPEKAIAVWNRRAPSFEAQRLARIAAAWKKIEGNFYVGEQIRKEIEAALNEEKS